MRKLAKRNPVAQDLRSPKYKSRTVASKKGVASYKRPSNRRPDVSRGGDSRFGGARRIGAWMSRHVTTMGHRKDTNAPVRDRT
jgi:hypothetical protein